MRINNRLSSTNRHGVSKILRLRRTISDESTNEPRKCSIAYFMTTCLEKKVVLQL